jgi:hypothetical protein
MFKFIKVNNDKLNPFYQDIEDKGIWICVLLYNDFKLYYIEMSSSLKRYLGLKYLDPSIYEQFQTSTEAENAIINFIKSNNFKILPQELNMYV